MVPGDGFGPFNNINSILVVICIALLILITMMTARDWQWLPSPFSLPTVLLLFCLLTSHLTHAHNIQMKAHTRECFHEQLHVDDKMTVTFQVGDREFGGSGNLEIDFWVRL